MANHASPDDFGWDPDGHNIVRQIVYDRCTNANHNVRAYGDVRLQDGSHAN